MSCLTTGVITAPVLFQRTGPDTVTAVAEEPGWTSLDNAREILYH